MILDSNIRNARLIIIVGNKNYIFSKIDINLPDEILNNIHINWQEGKLNWDKIWAVYTLEKWIAQNIK